MPRKILLPPENHPLRYVFHELPACPACRSVAIRIYGTRQAEDDGSTIRYARCVACAARFLLVAEPPERMDPGG